MKKLFIIANWKSNKTTIEAGDWLERLTAYDLQLTYNEIIVCPTFTLLPSLKSIVVDKNLALKLGGQDISPFDQGAYTGEVNAKQVKEFADYTIIGHSERRSNFKEDNEMLVKKVQQALKVSLTPIYCIQNENSFIPEGVTLVAYEPPSAIGTGNPDTPENAETVAGKVIKKYPYITSIIYGGSVTSENIRSFVVMEHINGVLVGGASLEVTKFAALIKNA